MTPEQFRATGRLIFGPKWKGKLARALVMDKRVVQRYASGDVAIPGSIIPELRKLQTESLGTAAVR